MAITQISNNVILDNSIIPGKLTVSSNLKTFLNSPTGTNLRLAVGEITGTGNLVFGSSPTLFAPVCIGAFISDLLGSSSANGSITIRGTNSSTRTTSNVNLQPTGGGVTIGTSTRNASAIFQIDSTTLGMLPPRMTIAQRNAISTPAEGLLVYVTDSGTKSIGLYNGTAWGNVLTSHTGSISADTLRDAVGEETGTGNLVFATSPTITSPTIATSLVLNATSYTYGSGAREGLLNSLSNRFVYKNGLVPFAEIFDDFPQVSNGIGSHRWVSNAGTIAYYSPASSSSSTRFFGAISLLTAASANSTANIYLQPTGGASGPTTNPIGMSMQTCFSVNNTTASEFRSKIGASGVSIEAVVLFGTGVLQLEITGLSTIIVRTGLSLAAGDFISGTRYRLFLRIISQTQTEIYFASSPWNSSTWTTIEDSIVTHSSWTPPSAGSFSSPIISLVTRDGNAKTGYIDWVAIRQEIQR